MATMDGSHRRLQFPALLMLFVGGLILGWSSPYLAQLTAPDSPLPISTDEASWVASLVSLGRLFGAVIGAVSVQYLGSKNTLTLIGLPFIICWVSLIVANSVMWIYLARTAAGIGIGMAFSSFPLFLGEISSPSIRGALVTLATTGLPLGTVAGNTIGAYISIQVFSYISLVPNVIFIVLFLWLPESPHHLIRRGKLEAATESLTRYSPKADVTKDIEGLRNFINKTSSTTCLDRLKEFNLPRNRKAVIIVILLYTFMQFSGLNSTTFYMEIILTDAKLTAIDPALMVIILGVIGIVAGWAAMLVADRCGRKPLMAGSSAGVGLSMVAIGVHFVLLKGGMDPVPMQWLPVLSMVGYQIFVYLGVTPVPSMVLSELFAPNIKSLAACMVSAGAGITGFASSKTYQPIVDTFGEEYVFWMQAAIMFFAVIFTATVVPETKGKTLQEIQEKLSRK
ncbi:facilitated trehalose transporter Tret1-like isoform X2 [Athalia rosae]|uniref:facilitated trehalose transporter Tret1-like isoform X2 n=1 Tax=Athalia rosae TaxID=37344 RepID=UPI0020347E5C|nr:facilitated trehalose transporter Tret1-like isoform X2 [Athalia rosae]